MMAGDPDLADPALVHAVAVSSECVTRAFDAYALGQVELCNALLAGGRDAAGAVFTYVIERVTSRAFPYQADSPHWAPFLAHLRFMVLKPPPAPVPPPRQVESEADFLKWLHRMVEEGEAKHAPVTPAEADELRALGLM